MMEHDEAVSAILDNDPILPGDALRDQARGPRRPRRHNARFLGSRAVPEVPAKDARRQRNKRQRQARKLGRR